MNTLLRIAAIALVICGATGIAYGESLTVNPNGDIQAAIDAMEIDDPGTRYTSYNTVVLQAGEYRLTGSLYLKPGVILEGAGAGATILRITSSGRKASTVPYWGDYAVSLSSLSGIHDLTLFYDGDNGILVDQSDTNLFRIGGVHILRSVAAGGTGIRVQPTPAKDYGSAVMDCLIDSYTDGIIATDAVFRIARCQFDNIAGNGVVINTAKQSSAQVPILGRINEPGDTGFNLFRNMGQKCLSNNSAQSIDAMLNDWGVYDAEGVSSWVQGPADTNNFMTKSLAPGSVIASVVDGVGDPVTDDAAPTCVITALNMNGVRDPNSFQFVFNGVPAGSWLVSATANGLPNGSATAEASALGVTQVTVRLGGSTCGANGKFAYGGAAIILAGVGYRRRRRLTVH